MELKNSYFYVVYSATTDCGKHISSSCIIEVEGGGMFNKQKTIDYICSESPIDFLVIPTSVVISNWIKFKSKKECDIFTY